MKKRTVLIIAIIAAIAAVSVLFAANFENFAASGIYYSQKDSGYYLQLKHGGKFIYAYNPQKDKTAGDSASNIQAYIENSGVWSVKKGKITLKFDDGNIVNLKKSGNYYYNTSTVYKGVYTNEKAFSKIYTYRYGEDENKYDSALFFDDLTFSFNRVRNGKPITKNGTYTRVKDLLTVRYNNEDNRAYRFLMLENGISDDLFSKKDFD